MKVNKYQADEVRSGELAQRAKIPMYNDVIWYSSVLVRFFFEMTPRSKQLKKR